MRFGAIDSGVVCPHEDEEEDLGTERGRSDRECRLKTSCIRIRLRRAVEHPVPEAGLCAGGGSRGGSHVA